MSEVNITCYCVACIHNKDKNCELKSISLDYVQEKSYLALERWAAACESFKEKEGEDEQG